MIHPEQVRKLNDAGPAEGRYVLYWMQQSQRARFNPALEYAIHQANRLGLPVLVAFGLTASYPEANARHYAFLLQGLRNVEGALEKRKIRFAVRHGEPDEVALELSRQAALVVCDRGYLRHQKRWRDRVAEGASCGVVQVEGDVVVPVDVVSDKQEYAARTIRPRIHRQWETYLVPLRDGRVKRDSRGMEIQGALGLSDPESILRRLDVDRSVPPVRRLRGGNAEARRRLSEFLRRRLPGYGEGRSEPAEWHSSLLSPYLHFGQISPVEVALKAQGSEAGSAADRASFLEELIIRRELSMNFVHRQPHYDAYRSLPDWARRTLREHAGDPRTYVYTRRQLESARTHDRYWNAAMREMVHTGFMQNYMRMYWGKKILEWSRTPGHAYRTALYLNNRYFLDGRDPNSYAGVAWCFGLHDRPWTERDVFGKVRYMNDRGLERKFDMERYIEAVDELVRAEGVEA